MIDSLESAFVLFQPSGRRDRVPMGLTLLDAARRMGVDIESPCGENQVCGKCKVRIETGQFNKEAVISGPDHASPWDAAEAEYITPSERDAGYRLGCVARVGGDLVVFVPEASRTHQQVISKAASDMSVALDPAVRQYTLQLQRATLSDPAADFERVAQALSDAHGLHGLTIDLYALRELPGAIRDGRWDVAVTVWQGREIIRVRSDPAGSLLGLAVDIGTTTIAGYLCDLATGDLIATASIMNPQVKYGEDVISRISYHMSRDDGLAHLAATLAEGLNQLIDMALEIARETRDRNMERTDIVDMTVCGNTAIQHFLLRLDPRPLGVVPFAPANHHSQCVKVRDLGLRIHPGAYVYVFPNQAGFVGGDNVGVILALAPHTDAELQLIIDIGTNGELVFGNRDGLMSTSCATGPALEGAQIKYGMRAAAGAIERVAIRPQSLDVDYKVVGRDPWLSRSRPQDMQVRGICGSGILDAVAEMFRVGIVLKSGAFAKEALSPRLRKDAQSGLPEFVLAWADETAIERDVVVTQKDIRQIQLAKAALYAGCKLMMRRRGVSRPDRVKIAGAFGSHVDRTLALVLGMFPDCPVDTVSSVGNAAGDGCRMALLNAGMREEADWIARNVTYMELSSEPDFQRHLVEATQFPHMTDPFPHLKGIVPESILGM